MVYILLADGFEDMEAVCPYDVLHRGGVPVAFVGLSDRIVTGAHGVKVTADLRPADVHVTADDYVVVPGGMGGVEGIEASAEAAEILRAGKAANAHLCAICAGPRALDKLGLIGDHRYTCYPGMQNEISGGHYVDLPACDDGMLITGRGPGCAIEFGLTILTAIRGAEISEKIRAGLVSA